jgi:hypothetical protein
MLTLFTFSCSEENVELKEAQYEIVKASATEKISVSGWISSSPSSRISSSFNIEELQKIVDLKNGYQILTILNSDNKNEAISFSLDENGQVAFSFLSKTIKSDNGDITNEIYDTEGILKFSYIDRQDGSRSIIYSENSTINGRTAGWWSDADDCVGKFHSLTGSNIGDIVVTTIFNSATLGLYTPLSLVLCAGYATAKLADK